jgi:hypothetical protein
VLVGNEKLIQLILTQDDYNYSVHNKRIFDMVIPVNELSDSSD